MSKYTFTFKKDNIFVEFTTTDKDVVENQFQIWVANADDYVRDHQKKPAQVAQETEEAKNKIQDTKYEEETIQPLTHSPVQPEIEQQPEVLDKASNLLRTINTIQGGVNVSQPSDKEKQTSVEAGVNAEIKTEASDVVSVEEKLAEATNFEEVLEKTIENPTFEPEKPQDQVFLNLIKSKNTTDKFHYLIITAYYLSEFEKMERFSLKQINAKLMQNLSEVIDHITLQEAINQNLIELVPDLTGVSEVGEYRLTPAGEDFFANKI